MSGIAWMQRTVARREAGKCGRVGQHGALEAKVRQ